jgi:hypothetical protein
MERESFPQSDPERVEETLVDMLYMFEIQYKTISLSTAGGVSIFALSLAA